MAKIQRCGGGSGTGWTTVAWDNQKHSNQGAVSYMFFVLSILSISKNLLYGSVLFCVEYTLDLKNTCMAVSSFVLNIPWFSRDLKRYMAISPQTDEFY